MTRGNFGKAWPVLLFLAGGVIGAYFFPMCFNIVEWTPYIPMAPRRLDFVQRNTSNLTGFTYNSTRQTYNLTRAGNGYVASHLQCIQNWTNGYFYGDMWVHRSDAECGRRIFTSREIRDVLRNKAILFNGDSQTRRWFNTIDFLTSEARSMNFKLIDPKYLGRGGHSYFKVNNSDFYIEYQWNVNSDDCKLKKRQASYTHVMIGFGLHQALHTVSERVASNGNRSSIRWLRCIQKLTCQTCNTAPRSFWKTSPFSGMTGISSQDGKGTVKRTNAVISTFNRIARIALFQGGHEQNFEEFESRALNISLPALHEFGIPSQEIREFAERIHKCCSKSGSLLYLFDIETMLMPRSVQDRIEGDGNYHFGDAARIAMTHAFMHAIAYTS